MNPTVTALYETRAEADRALRLLKAELSLASAEIYDPTDAGRGRLQELDLTEELRDLCERKLATGEYMLLAMTSSGEEADRIIAVLETAAADDPGPPDSETSLTQSLVNEDPQASAVVAEERLPLVEEELRVATREVVRGGARVRTRVEVVPLSQEIELIEEFARVEKRPVTRLITDQEVKQAGLLRDRVIEIAQVRQEAVIDKEAFVREEVVITKTTGHRVEQVHETLRHTEVESEKLAVDPPEER